MGRHAAGEGFLRGFVTHGDIDEFYAHTLNADHFADFTRRIRQIAGGSRPCRRVDHTMFAQDGAPDLLQLPGPDLSPFAWRRRTRGTASYSLCGLNHTVASAKVMSSLGDLLTAPIQPWDALICTSQSSKSAMRHVMDGYAAYLEGRIGARPPLELMMPVIPLGVDCDAFAQDETASADRARLRQGLGITADDVVLLFVGRLSFHAKAHPLPFYIAAETAARRTGRRVHLIQAGWFANDAIEKEFRDGARSLCPSVNAIYLDGRDSDVRRRIWRAADVFVSLSDNIQETFGLTPVEAMAAGLPVVVSDWNGYRETVKNGTHGFTIPTWMPPGGEGGDIAFAPELDIFDSVDEMVYDRYCGAVSQSTVVDTGVCIDVLSVLCNDADKRHALGEAGRQHARETFDWSVVVKAYQELWEELNQRRLRASKEPRHMHPAPDVPLRSDPFTMFSAYPTSLINEATELRLIDGVNETVLDERLSMNMNSFAMKNQLGRDDLIRIVNILLERGSATVGDIIDAFDDTLRSRVVLSVGWLAKMYLIRLTGGVIPLSESAEAKDTASMLPEDWDGSGDAGALDMLARQGDGKPGISLDDALFEELEGLSVPELNEKSLTARSQGDIPLAAACLHRASTLEPDDPDINVQMGELLSADERYDAAVACFRRAIHHSPDYLKAHTNLGKALFLRGDEAEGIHSFRRAVRTAPEDGEARLLLGTALRRAGAVNEALQCLRIALEIDPERVEAGYQLGLVFNSMERTDEARATFERVLSTDPNYRFADAAIRTMEAEEHGRAVSERYEGRKIALHMTDLADYFALKPIFDVLCADHWPLFSADIREIADFNPAAVLTPSSRLSALQDAWAESSVIQVPDKAFRSPGNIKVGPQADAVAVVTEQEQQAYLELGVSQERIWLTGLPLMDPVFSGAIRQQSSGKKKSGLQQVLYMPDWRRHVSAERLIQDQLVKLCQIGEGRFEVSIVPHPMTVEYQRGWVENWTDLSSSCRNLNVHDTAGSDFLSLMVETDLLIADFSLMALTFLAFDAPMVLVRPSAGTPQYPPLGEQQIDILERTATCLDENDEDPCSLIMKVFEHKKDMDEQRARLRSVVYGGNADGRAALRTVSSLRHFLDT